MAQMDAGEKNDMAFCFSPLFHLRNLSNLRHLRSLLVPRRSVHQRAISRRHLRPLLIGDGG